ncbi:MAG: Rieske (2Fe-2S) domain protein [Ilumatobacteraceae bacterium]|nr:Rieske (2Fe-2S) domain protein [Ilumatobacteraceae bacterium]
MTAPDQRPHETEDGSDPVGDEPSALARRGELLTAAAFLSSVVGALGLSVVYWRGGQPQLEGLFLAVALGGIGIGLVMWARYFLPKVAAVEERHELGSTEEEVAEFRETFEQGEHLLTRRRLLVRSATAALVALGAAFVFPLRSLGPRPGRGFRNTPFRDGVRLVTDDGQPVRVGDVASDGVLTVFPEGHVGSADAPTLLLRPDVAVRPRAGREDWTPDGLVAYSKLCTHVGCPVGLYQSEQHLLLCPCHQSTFDVLDGARPVFGPAARSLPQLPLDIDDDGFVIARGDFSGPPGPGFWDRDRGSD